MRDEHCLSLVASSTPTCASDSDGGGKCCYVKQCQVVGPHMCRHASARRSGRSTRPDFIVRFGERNSITKLTDFPLFLKCLKMKTNLHEVMVFLNVKAHFYRLTVALS